MTAKDCIVGRRSIRKFKADAVSPRAFVRDRRNRFLLAELEAHTDHPLHCRRGRIKGKDSQRVHHHVSPNGDIIAAAPVLMAVTVIKNRSGYERDGSFSTPRGDGWQMYDAGIASQSLCLAAYEQGLGSVILGLFDQSAAEALLQLPEDRELVALIPIGYPDETPVAPRRKPVDELLSYLS